MSAVCQNCGDTWPLEALKPIKDLHERVAPGESMPAGECPGCGCLCHEEPQQVWRNWKHIK